MVATQWRVAGTMERIVRTGIDYTAARAGWDLAGLTTTPDLFEEVRAIERGALAQMQEDRT